LQEKLKPVALDVAIMRRSIEQLAFNQDQLARKQEQMTQAIAALQAAEQDISQKILALAPPAPKPVHVSPKPVQPPAQ
jgi:prefoldin subunit 5